ncbi:hypothetical protein ACIP9H_19235 [Streptomyces sp. NPDC088732]|uniref:hypothetical protein n=1 Tax=Streptomyces sp. NPDC088732 TaxID=3365879 RepID=UPI0037F492D1
MGGEHTGTGDSGAAQETAGVAVKAGSEATAPAAAGGTAQAFAGAQQQVPWVPQPVGALDPQRPKSRRVLFLALGLVVGFGVGAFTDAGPWADDAVSAHLPWASTYHLVPRAEFRGMAQMAEDDPEIVQALDNWNDDTGAMKQLIESIPDVTPVVTGYRDAEQQRDVSFLGFEARDDIGLDPDEVLDTAFGEEERKQSETELAAMAGGKTKVKVTYGTRRQVDSDVFDGRMHCALVTVTAKGTARLGFCVWADRSTIGTVTSTGRNGEIDLDSLTADARALRLATEVPR